MDQRDAPRYIQPNDDPRYRFAGGRPVRPIGITILSMLSVLQATIGLVILVLLVLLVMLAGPRVRGLDSGLLVLGGLVLFALWVASHYLLAFGFWRMERYIYWLALVVYLFTLVTDFILVGFGITQPNLASVIWNFVNIFSLVYLVLPGTRKYFR